MQEPLLFNESIKENILYGDQMASDQKVREVSINSNSLPFIMQTEEDFSSTQVHRRLREQFKAICNLELGANSKLSALVDEMVNSGSELEFKTLYFLNQILPLLSAFGIADFEKNFEHVRRAIQTMQD